MTRSYIMIFLIIRSPCWTASNFQSTQQGTQVSEMRAGRFERCEVLNVKCELWRDVSIFKLVSGFLRFSISIRAILQVFCQALLTYKRFRWFKILSVAYRAFSQATILYVNVLVKSRKT